MSNDRKRRTTLVKRRLMVFGTLSVVIIASFGYAVFCYWIQIIDKAAEKQILENEFSYLKEQETNLKTEIDKLQDPEYIIRYAKENYLFSGDDELIFTLLKKKD